MPTLHNTNLVTIDYADIVKACDGENFDMKLAPSDAEVVTRAVNIGIDSRLEACNVPDRGDRYEHRNGKLCCDISPESLPVLIRRLIDSDGQTEDDDIDNAMMLGGDILTTLGFNEYGKFVGREALGLD